MTPLSPMPASALASKQRPQEVASLSVEDASQDREGRDARAEDAPAFWWVVKAIALAVLLIAVSLVLMSLGVSVAVVGVGMGLLALLAVLIGLPLLGSLQRRLRPPGEPSE